MIEQWKQVSIYEALAPWLCSEMGTSAGPSGPSHTLTSDQYQMGTEAYGLFLRFLPHCDWFRVRVTSFDDMNALKIIDEVSWEHNNASGNRSVSRRWPLDDLPQMHAEKVNSFAKIENLHSVLDGKTVLFGHDRNDHLTILDGNHRLLAYASRINRNSEVWSPFEAFVGISLGPCRWHGDAESWMERPPRNPNERRYVLNIW